MHDDVGFSKACCGAGKGSPTLKQKKKNQGEMGAGEKNSRVA
jgi:hypothetical protein